MSDGERRLIEGATTGDRAAFRQLFQTHARAVYAVCLRLLGDRMLAEDAVQETFLNAYRGLRAFDGRAEFGTWLHRIAVNAALALRRGAGARPHESLDELEVPVDIPLGPLQCARDHDLRVALTAALEDLSPLERASFVGRHLEQFSLAEIADAQGSNVNAIKQAVFRAVHKLRVRLSPWRQSA
jgi:RNA polymerase sigma-70 factor (ECF subfamily)